MREVPNPGRKPMALDMLEREFSGYFLPVEHFILLKVDLLQSVFCQKAGEIAFMFGLDGAERIPIKHVFGSGQQSIPHSFGFNKRICKVLA
jgi:hypothetical protein